MISAKSILLKHGIWLTESKSYAFLWAALFAVLPFTGWLSVAIVGLVTLRKGKEAGFNLLLPCMVTYLLASMILMPLPYAIGNTLLTFVPVYISACVLRQTGSWSLVSFALLLQVIVATLLVQCIFPNAITAQYQHFQAWLATLPDIPNLTVAQKYIATVDPLLMAHLFFSIQALTVICATIISLISARFIQAMLFFRDGFIMECANFRSGKHAFALLLIIVGCAYLHITLAFDLLPLMLFYFLLSGFILVVVISARNKMRWAIGILLISMFIRPNILLLACSFLGILDSLFNFREFKFKKINEISVK